MFSACTVKKKKKSQKQGMMVHACHPSTQEAEARES
jgi:hypothetical protein